MDNKSSLIYVTGNALKFRVAEQALQGSGIVLEQASLRTPEIQSEQVDEIARWSAVWASRKLGKPVVVMDAGFYIEALNGFPGPFIKFVNKWFSADDYLNLMMGKSDRSVSIHDCLAYCRPTLEPVSFCQLHRGHLATQPGRSPGSSIDQLFIPEGFDLPISEIPPHEMLAYWSSATIWQELEAHLENKAG
jgi:XTP/dITP diphosphohydrolase